MVFPYANSVLMDEKDRTNYIQTDKLSLWPGKYAKCIMMHIFAYFSPFLKKMHIIESFT